MLPGTRLPLGRRKPLLSGHCTEGPVTGEEVTAATSEVKGREGGRAVSLAPLCWGKEKGQGFPGGSTTPSPARWLTLQLHPRLENCSDWKHESSKSWTKRAAYNPPEAQGSSHSSLPLEGSEPGGGGGGMQWCVGVLCAEFPEMHPWMH